MKIVVDTNIIIAALIKDSRTREVLSSSKFQFVSPDFVLEEVYKYKEKICEKAILSDEEFELLLVLIFENIEIIPFEDYAISLRLAEEIMKNDLKDAPYVACYLAIKCEGIWTNDSDYEGKEGLRILGTKDMLELLQ